MATVYKLEFPSPVAAAAALAQALLRLPADTDPVIGRNCAPPAAVPRLRAMLEDARGFVVPDSGGTLFLLAPAASTPAIEAGAARSDITVPDRAAHQYGAPRMAPVGGRP